MTDANEYQPDYAVPPGWILEEYLQVLGMSQAKFAQRCGRTPKLISEIIAGKAPIEHETAMQFETVLGLKAYIWMGIEADYQLYQTQQNRIKKKKTIEKWAKKFPVNELMKRGYLSKNKNKIDLAEGLLSFFRVASPKAWEQIYGQKNVAYRHSPSFQSDKFALATWLRLGEAEAEEQEINQYNKTEFKKAVAQIRNLTQKPIDEALPQTIKLCNETGVALVVTPPFKKTALSGAAWWMSPKKPIILLSARHKSNDHFWFSFFHEAAHILLHGKKTVFVDGTEKNNNKIEDEANEWATNMLIPRKAWNEFIDTNSPSEDAVRTFAKKQGIAPGIVVGMLQHEKHLSWGQLNGLKIKLKWEDQKTLVEST